MGNKDSLRKAVSSAFKKVMLNDRMTTSWDDLADEFMKEVGFVFTDQAAKSWTLTYVAADGRLGGNEHYTDELVMHQRLGSLILKGWSIVVVENDVPAVSFSRTIFDNRAQKTGAEA